MELPYFSIEIWFEVDLAEIPEYQFHSAFRGLFGRMLKMTCCIQKRLDCSGCPMRMCLYRRIFEEEGKGFERFHPYIVRHVKTEGRTIVIELTILGSVSECASSILHCIMRMEELPLRIDGASHKMKVISIKDSEGQSLYGAVDGTTMEPAIRKLRFVPMAVDEMTLRFVTPMRMKHEGRLMSRFVWKAFMRSIFYRLQYLNEHYHDPRSGLPALWDDEPEIISRFQWQEMFRTSMRQGQKMSLGGLIGTVRILDPKPETAGLLRMGEVIHAGKQTTFGLGKYTIETSIPKEVG